VAWVSRKTDQFTYFSLQVGESIWRGKKVLDFGGNIGNLLRDPNSTIDPEGYWCLDVDREALDQGHALQPKSHWVFYNRYCFFFNPHGVPNLELPVLDQTFDYIVAYSVFTNTTRTDMLQLVDQLRGLLTPKGTLAFTFIDPHHFSWPGRYHGNNFMWRLEREEELAEERGDKLNLNKPELMRRAQRADWLMLVNSDDLYVETEAIRAYEADQQRTCHAFYTAAFMKNLFPQATVLPPVNNEMQHCCLIRN
jgi:SAM-dependent methyltransferase